MYKEVNRKVPLDGNQDVSPVQEFLDNLQKHLDVL